MTLPPLPVLVVLGFSAAVSLQLLRRIWTGSDSVFLKVLYTCAVWAPVIGPLMVLWIRGMPESQHPDLRDRAGFSTDILERWRDRLTQAGLMKPGWRWIDRKPRRQRLHGHDRLS